MVRDIEKFIRSMGPKLGDGESTSPKKEFVRNNIIEWSASTSPSGTYTEIILFEFKGGKFCSAKCFAYIALVQYSTSSFRVGAVFTKSPEGVYSLVTYMPPSHSEFSERVEQYRKKLFEFLTTLETMRNLVKEMAEDPKAVGEPVDLADVKKAAADIKATETKNAAHTLHLLSSGQRLQSSDPLHRNRYFSNRLPYRTPYHQPLGLHPLPTPPQLPYYHSPYSPHSQDHTQPPHHPG